MSLYYVETKTGSLLPNSLLPRLPYLPQLPVFDTKIPEQPATERGCPERVRLGKTPSALSGYVAKKSAISPAVWLVVGRAVKESSQRLVALSTRLLQRLEEKVK